MNEIEKASNLGEIENTVAKTVDAVTRARAGSLAAHGLLDTQIADMLLLSLEQVVSCRETEEYKLKYAEVANEQIQRQLDLEEGWDGVEEKAIEQVLSSLQYNRDPKFALIAAATANKAKRRGTDAVRNPRTIDGSAPGGNIVILNLNKTYINNNQGENKTTATIDVTPRVENQQRKVTDLPSPKAVEELLAPVRQAKQKVLTELELAFEISGVFDDSDER
jgi:hypothetical protein